MNDQNKPLVGELELRDALSRVAAQYGKVKALQIVEEWNRTKLEVTR